jgi:hypothetical protein
MDILALDEAPDDESQVADDVLIGVAVWAKYQGVEVGTVYRSNVRAKEERATAAEESRPVKPGMMPEPARVISNGPYWTMAQFREWKASRPGRGVGGGRQHGAVVGRYTPSTAKLPLVCPCGCNYVITASDVADLPAPEKTPGKLTPRQVDKMTPAERTKALVAGKLNHLVGTAKQRRGKSA